MKNRQSLLLLLGHITAKQQSGLLVQSGYGGCCACSFTCL